MKGEEEEDAEDVDADDSVEEAVGTLKLQNGESFSTLISGSVYDSFVANSTLTGMKYHLHYSLVSFCSRACSRSVGPSVCWIVGDIFFVSEVF